jgi:hypothetical protein
VFTPLLFGTIKEIISVPKKAEKQLRKQGIAKGLSGERLSAYIYGTLRKKFGWKPSKGRKKLAKPGR